jgi:hypothetical protein
MRDIRGRAPLERAELVLFDVTSLPTSVTTPHPPQGEIRR